METLGAKLGLNVNFPFVLTMAALIWTRVLAMVSVIPFLFAKPAPQMARVGTSIVITIFLYPILVTGNAMPPEVGMYGLPVLFLKEILFGLAMGFMVSIMFYGFQSAGQMIDNQRGVSLARILIPELGEQASITSHFMFQFAVVLFLVLGGHRLFLKSFIESYQVLPLFQFPESVAGLQPLMTLFIVMTGKVIFISIQIAAPVIVAILMADIILGVANRFAPQINVWELGFNIRGYIGILMLFLSLSIVARQVEHYTREGLRSVAETVEHLKAPPPPGTEEEKTPEEERLEIPVPVVPVRPQVGT